MEKSNEDGQYKKKIFKMTHNRVIQISSEIHKHIRSYSKGSPINTETYKTIRNENNSFIKAFKLAKKKQQEDNSKTSVLSDNNMFTELYAEYKKKGYKIPKLSLDHNLFENNPLLDKDDDIKEFYSNRLKNEKKIDIEKVNEKNLKYLNKLNSILYRKQDNRYFKYNTRKRKASLYYDEPETEILNGNYIKENEEIKNYINTINEFIDKDKKNRKSFTDLKQGEIFIRTSRTKKNTYNNPILTSPTKSHNEIIQRFETQSNELGMTNPRKRFSVSKFSIISPKRNSSKKILEKSNRGVMITNLKMLSLKKPILKERPPLSNRECYPRIFSDNLDSLSREQILTTLSSNNTKDININNVNVRDCIDYYFDKYKSNDTLKTEIYNQNWTPEKMVKYSKSIIRKVKNYNVADIWKTNASRVGKYELVEGKLEKVEKLDKTLSSLDYYIIKKTCPKS